MNSQKVGLADIKWLIFSSFLFLSQDKKASSESSK
jgi:hypothetical protein